MPTEYLRPNSNVTQTNFTNGYAEIDETPASNTDFAYGANNTAAVLEVGTTDLVDTYSAATFRWRVAKTNAGTVDDTGNGVNVTPTIYEGGTLRWTGTTQAATGTWTEYTESSIDLSAISDWTDVRFRFTTTASGGSPANRRGGAVSWAELEVTTVSSRTATLNNTLDAATLTASGDVDIGGALAGTLDGTTLTGAGDLDLVGTVAGTLDDTALAGSGDIDLSGTLDSTLADTTLGSNGTLTSPPLDGTLDSTLDAFTLTGDADLELAGLANVTLANWTMVGNSNVGTPPSIQTIFIHRLRWW